MPNRTHAPALVALTQRTHDVLTAIRGIGGRPMLVGGCVRDALLNPGSTPKDIDIEVYDITDVDHLCATLTQIARVDAVGASFGVLKMTLPDGTDLDIALPRRDSKVRPGHRGFIVQHGLDITEAEATGRRDYTINALMWDPATHELVDHWDGVADLNAGVLRHCTPAFADDPLRVLRAVQFAARFNLTMAPDTVAMCRSLRGEFATVAAEGIWGEWKKLLTRGRHFTAAIAILEDTGWIDFFPELAATRHTAQDPTWHPEGDVLTHLALAATEAATLADAQHLSGSDRVVVVAAALMHDVGKVTHTTHEPDGRITSHGHAEAGVTPAKALLGRIGAPQPLIVRILPLIAEHMCATTTTGTPSRAAVRRLARRLGPATIGEWSLVCGADQAGRGTGAKPNNTLPWLEVAASLGVETIAPPCLLKGEHLIALGHRPSAAFRGVMEHALQAQDDDEFSDEAGALAWLERIRVDGRLERYLADAAKADQARHDRKEQARTALREQARAQRAARHHAHLADLHTTTD